MMEEIEIFYQILYSLLFYKQILVVILKTLRFVVSTVILLT